MPGVRKKITSSWAAIATSALIAATSIVPAQAQLSAPQIAAAAGNAASAPFAAQNNLVIQVSDDRRYGPRAYSPNWRVRDRNYRHRRNYRRHRNNDGAAIVGGIVGLTTGLILGGALNRPYYNDRDYGRYYDPYYGRSRTYYRPAPPPPVYRGRHAAWSPEWYAYCARKYRSFNPRTGYYLAYSGQYRFCR
ncbi:BA14K family protein [Breoghania sp. L-A4]|uniref:BA14K family protein n=1 Tax=Breoghania sp. L-A4 TaxID=2304600 RepID=UPI000E360A4A|nr:BA14K family protein [Breoghania sp. L-A4]AXS41350.1 BA14K family protein [Breoghania sp. L-A4]